MAGGGLAVFKVRTVSQAFKILRAFQSQMAFWQISRVYYIKKGRGRARQQQGYSQAFKRNAITQLNIKRALDGSAVNAANTLGFNFKYEGGKPDIVTPKGKTFYVLIWFNKRSRQTFLRLTEREE